VKLELAMLRQRNGLVPAGSYDLEKIEGIPHGSSVMVTVQLERNVQHHKKLWALAARVADFCDDFSDAEDAVVWIKLQVPSMRKEYHFRDGKLVIAVRSIDFASMDQLEFNTFYEKACMLWSQLIGCDVETLTKGMGK
jgi:hypothetical protein